MSKQSIAIARMHPEKKAPSDSRAPYKPLAPGCKVPFHVVQANRFELVDASGRICGGFGFTDQGDPMIGLCEENGKTLRMRAEIKLTKDGPYFALTDSHGKARMVIRATEGGIVGLNFRDERGSPRMAFGLDKVPFASIFDKRGRAIGFVKRAFAPLTAPRLTKVLRPLAVAGKKKEFLVALADTFDIHDSRDVEELWQVAQAALKEEAKAEKKRTRKAAQAA